VLHQFPWGVLRFSARNSDFVGQHFGEAPSHGESVRDVGVAVGDFADAEFSDERSVSGQDPEVGRRGQGISISSATSLTTWRSGSNDLELETYLPIGLGCGLHLLGFFENFVDAALEVKTPVRGFRRTCPRRLPRKLLTVSSILT